MFFKTGVLKNFANFTGKQLCWSFFLRKLLTETPTQLFSCEICNIFKNTFDLQNTSSGCFCPSTIQQYIWVYQILNDCQKACFFSTTLLTNLCYKILQTLMGISYGLTVSKSHVSSIIS